MMDNSKRHKRSIDEGVCDFVGTSALGGRALHSLQSYGQDIGPLVRLFQVFLPTPPSTIYGSPAREIATVGSIFISKHCAI